LDTQVPHSAVTSVAY